MTELRWTKELPQEPGLRGVFEKLSRARTHVQNYREPGGVQRLDWALDEVINAVSLLADALTAGPIHVAEQQEQEPTVSKTPTCRKCGSEDLVSEGICDCCFRADAHELWGLWNVQEKDWMQSFGGLILYESKEEAEISLRCVVAKGKWQVRRYSPPEPEPQHPLLAAIKDIIHDIRRTTIPSDKINAIFDEAEKLIAERDKLQAFKDWVHSYLDGKGVPPHPPGVHGAAGCRIGDRMDLVFAELTAAKVREAELSGMLRECAERLEIEARNHDSWPVNRTNTKAAEIDLDLAAKARKLLEGT